MFSDLHPKERLLNLFFQPKAILIFLLLFSVAYFFLAHEGFYFNDDYGYARMAADLRHGRFQFQDLPAYHRFMIFGPVALLYKLFGISIYTVSLWPLLCTLGSLVFIYFLLRKEDIQVTVWALLLSGLMFPTLFLSVYLFPDTIIMFFALASAGILYAGRRAGKNPVMYALAFVLANFAALLSKETIVWYLPFYIWVAGADFFRKKHTVFWLASVGFGALILAVYLGIYKLHFGSFLYRFQMIENTNLTFGDNFINAPDKNLWYRLTREPLEKMLGFGIFLPLAFCFRFLRSKAASQIFNLNFRESFWFWLTVIILLQFWFGSTSLNYYNPITTGPRMATPLFPPLCLAAAYQLRAFFRDFKGALWFAIPLLAAALYTYSSISIVYGLPGLYFLYVWWQSRKGNLALQPLLFSVILTFALALRPLHFMLKPTVSSFFEQEQIAEDYFQNPEIKTAVFADGWFQKSAEYYFKFEPHLQVKILNYDDVGKAGLQEFEKIYLLVNKSTLTNPDLQFKKPVPGFTITEAEIYSRFPNRKLVATKGKVLLYEVLTEK